MKINTFTVTGTFACNQQRFEQKVFAHSPEHATAKVQTHCRVMQGRNLIVASVLAQGRNVA